MASRRPTNLFATILLILVPMIVFATPTKQTGESIQIEVVSTKTNYHGSSPKVFEYTEIMFARVNGKKLVFVCAQRADECPLIQAGKTYSADRVGNFIYLSMSSPDGKKSMPVKYKETGTW